MKKRFLSLLMAIVMLTTVIVPVAFASYAEEVIISIPERDFSSSYSIYSEQWMAERDSITIYVSKDEFPVYAEICSGGYSNTYEFNSYGTKIVHIVYNSDASIIAGLFTFGFSLLAESHRYAAIEIKPYHPKPTATPEPTSELSDEVLEELFEESGLPEEDVATCQKYLKDYFSGDWDGIGTFTSNGSFYDLDPLTRSYTFLTSNLEEPMSLNIDYLGDLEVEAGNDCSFAYDVSSGTIEQWQFFEKKSSWKIPYFDGENISYGIIPFSTADGKTVARVIVYNDNKALATYNLKDQHKVEKIS